MSEADFAAAAAAAAAAATEKAEPAVTAGDADVDTSTAAAPVSAPTSNDVPATEAPANDADAPTAATGEGVGTGEHAATVVADAPAEPDADLEKVLKLMEGYGDVPKMKVVAVFSASTRRTLPDPVNRKSALFVGRWLLAHEQQPVDRPEIEGSDEEEAGDGEGGDVPATPARGGAGSEGKCYLRLQAVDALVLVWSYHRCCLVLVWSG